MLPDKLQVSIPISPFIPNLINTGKVKIAGLMLVQPGSTTDWISRLLPHFLPDDESRIHLSKLCNFMKL